MLLQSLLRPVLTPLMRGMFDAPIASSAAWSPIALWPDGIDSPGMWISPRDLTSQWQDSAGTTPVATPGTVADSSNPVGLALDLRASPVTSSPSTSDLSGVTWVRYAATPLGNQITFTGQYGNIGNIEFFPANTAAVSIGRIVLTLDIEHVSGNTNLSTVFRDSAVPGENVIYPLILTSGQRTTLTQIHVFIGDVPPTVPQIHIVQDRNASNFAVVKLHSVTYAYTPGLHMLQSTSAARPLLSAYDGQTLGPGDTYDSAGYPIFQLYDGVDDGMATAAFAAGTLIDGMDCMIALRRDSAAACVAGLYNGIADATKFFGMAESASGSGCVGSGAGTPTVWVDNTQLTGGTAVTRGTLHTALTAGSYHILEFRNLDLSAWTATGFGLYASYVFPGARGDIMLYPSTASTTDKDAARQYLADKYGVTLP